MKFLEVLLGAPVKVVADFFTRRMELKAAQRQQEAAVRQALAERQVELIKEGLHADMQWELEMARQAQSSWKDEYTLIVVSLPAIFAFIRTPWFDGPAIVAQGFDALAKTPGWYQLVLVSLFLATVGIRYWRRQQSDT